MQMSSPIKPPTIISKKDGMRELIWVLPGAFHGARFRDILMEEANIEASVSQVDKKNIVVKAHYPKEKSNEVIFACFVFHKIVKQCDQLNKIYFSP